MTMRCCPEAARGGLCRKAMAIGRRFVIWAAVLMSVSLFECQGFKAGEYKVITPVRASKLPPSDV